MTLRLLKRRVAIVSLGHQAQRRIALGMAITPRLAYSMLRLVGVSEACDIEDPISASNRLW